MQLFLKLFLFLHVFAGIVTLIAGPIAIFYNFKNVRAHRLAGKIFFYAMLFVVVSSVFGFIKRPDAVFYQFLLGIAVLVFSDIMRGTRAILFMKKRIQVGPIDYAHSVLLGIFALGMLGMSAWHLSKGTMIAFPILFGVFGTGALLNTVRNCRLFSNPALVTANKWYLTHISSMIGAFIASTTAFTVNVGQVLPWYLQWFGPTLLLVPVQIYFLRKVKIKA